MVGESYYCIIIRRFYTNYMEFFISDTANTEIRMRFFGWLPSDNSFFTLKISKLDSTEGGVENVGYI